MNAICLNMIIKDEEKVIQRCLDSVKKIIDYWVIVDTGSTDDTRRRVLESLQGVPGILYERSWVDFETNRNQALQLAMGLADYILILDADDTLEISDEFNKNDLDKDGYVIACKDPIVDSYRLMLIKDHPDWKWVGVLHEELHFPSPIQCRVLPGVVKNGMHRDGERGKDPKRYLKDAAILQNECSKDPDNPRLVFYLAQSYAAAYENDRAIQYYAQRSEMGGDKDEVFWSIYFSACLKENMNLDSQMIIESYHKAYQYDPSRAEPLCFLARYLLKIGNFALAYLCARVAVSLKRPQTIHFVQREVYEYSSLLFLAYSEHLLRLYGDAEKSYHKLLKIKELPDRERCVVQNFLLRSQKKLPIQIS